LEQLGVRFYGPGSAGTVLPERITLPDTMSRAEQPAFLTRGFWAWEPRGNHDFFLWMVRNRLNLWTADEHDLPFLRKLGYRLMRGGHRIQLTFLDPKAEYPYRHAGLPASSAYPPDPYAVALEYRGDANHDGRLSYAEAHPEWYGLADGKRRPLICGDQG